ncbi:pyruvate ferredoxin oxidoreductase [Candidatus Woesearchaeota archaeon]|nr:pyruvate ferredoxin oxidoreductase [Candidatus Woesearchaeota archaeon]
MDFKEFARQPQKLASGQKSCSGCGYPIIVRMAMSAIDEPFVVCQGTGCISVTTTTWPYTSWTMPTIHNAFPNLASTASGVEAAIKVQNKKGKLKKNIKVVAIGGDGGTYDIGLQALSGAIERKHDMLYICYDNQAYMNTGGQRSSATPYGAATATTPSGTLHHGKELFRKDLTRIIAAHDISYVAQASLCDFADFTRKVKRAMEVKGFAFINVLSPCVLFWKINTCDANKVSQLAVDTCFWPLYEVDHGKWILNYKPEKKLSIKEFIKIQGRFTELMKPENKNILDGLQERVDRKWKELLYMCEKDKIKPAEKKVAKEAKKEVPKKEVKKPAKKKEVKKKPKPIIKSPKTKSRLAKLKDKLKGKKRR